LGYTKHEQKSKDIFIQLHTFIGHNDAVNAVSWSPHSPVQFATASSDRKVVVWDMERLGENTA
jgi:WD40 repeat protein